MFYSTLTHQASLKLNMAHLMVMTLALHVVCIQAEPEEVVVVGTAYNKVLSHVSGIVSANRENQIARWNSSLCLRVEGLPSELKAIIRQRLTLASAPVRLSVLGEGCAHNVLLFFSSDASSVSHQLAEHFEVPLRQDSTRRVTNFMDSRAAVRWINTYDRCGFGCRLANSRITASSAPSINFMLVVVDIAQIQGHSFQDIADYLAFVILSNPSPQAAPALNSVLGLFDSAPGTSAKGGLSTYDQVYLDALYTLPMDRYVETQRNAISASMLARLATLQE